VDHMLNSCAVVRRIGVFPIQVRPAAADFLLNDLRDSFGVIRTGEIEFCVS
jgi:hypothetical protein